MEHSMKVSELLERIKRHNTLYRSGNPEVDDVTYDAEVEELRSIDPENEWFSKIEPSPVNNSRKRKLPIPMKSLDKVKDMGDVGNWIKSCGLSDGDYIVIQPKYDGLSMLVNEETREAFTRGGAENEGQDCSEHFRMSRRSTTRFTALKYTYGEFLITRNSWKKNFEGKLQDNGNPFKSPRNTAAGILNREDPIEMTRNCEFIRYGADFESMRELCDSFFEFSSNILESESVRVTVSELMVNGHDWLMKLFNSYNESVPADGIVLYVDNLDRWKELGRKENGNPNYAIAYKHPDMTESYRTTVQRIEWQISKAGYMKPVVIVDDVDNGDCIMNSPTGYNARYIKENKIGYGAEVLLTRSGGVIPKIISVVEQANEFDCSLPTICPHCGEPLCFNESGVELMCVNKSCPGIRLAKCVFFYDTMKAENVGPALIKAMFDAGIDSVDRMVHVLPEDLYKIEGFGDGIANYILEANKKIMSGVELPVLMHASDCFEGLGQVKLRAMLDKYPQVEDMFMHGGWVEAGPEEGMSKTEAAFMVGLNSFSDFFYETCIPLKAPEAIVIAGDKCNGWSVCFSGVRDADLERLIESNGGKIASGVSKNTTHLVVKDTETTSSKIEKAKKLGVRIISIEDFKQSL